MSKPRKNSKDQSDQLAGDPSDKPQSAVLASSQEYPPSASELLPFSSALSSAVEAKRLPKAVAQFKQDVAACTITVPVFFMLSEGIVSPARGYSSLAEAFGSVYGIMDLQKQGKSDVTWMGLKEVPVEAFQQVLEELEVTFNQDMAIEEWLSSRESDEIPVAIKFLKTHLKDPQTIKNFLLSYSMNSAQVGLMALQALLNPKSDSAAVGVEAVIVTNINVQQGDGHVPVMTSLCRDVRLTGHEAKEMEAKSFWRPDDRLVIHQQFCGMKETKLADGKMKTGGEFKVSFQVNSLGLAQRIFDKYCDYQLVQLARQKTPPKEIVDYEAYQAAIAFLQQVYVGVRQQPPPLFVLEEMATLISPLGSDSVINPVSLYLTVQFVGRKVDFCKRQLDQMPDSRNDKDELQSDYQTIQLAYEQSWDITARSPVELLKDLQALQEICNLINAFGVKIVPFADPLYHQLERDDESRAEPIETMAPKAQVPTSLPATTVLSDRDIQDHTEDFKRDMAECQVLIPVCFMLPDDRIFPEYPYASLLEAFHVFMKDLTRDGPITIHKLEVNQRSMLMGLQQLPVAQFKEAASLLNKISDRKAAGAKLEGWLSSPTTAPAAIQFLMFQLKERQAVENFLWSYSQNYYSTGVTALMGLFSEMGVFIDVGVSTNITVEQSSRGYKPLVETLYRNIWKNKEGEIAIDPAQQFFELGDMLMIHQRFCEIKQVTAAKTGEVCPRGEFKATFLVNSPKFAERIFVKYCDNQLAKLAGHLVEQKVSSGSFTSTLRSSFTSSGSFTLLGKKKAPDEGEIKKREMHSFLKMVYDQIKTKLPKHPKFVEVMRDMARKVAPVEDEKGDNVITPASLYLTVQEIRYLIDKCSEPISASHPKKAELLTLWAEIKAVYDKEWDFSARPKEALMSDFQLLQQAYGKTQQFQERLKGQASAGISEWSPRR